MYVREHAVASEHPLATSAKRKADLAVKRQRKADRKRADMLRAKAEKLLQEASQLESLANSYYEYETKYAKLRHKIEDAGYWAAREAVGTFERDDNGAYVTEAPLWRVFYKGEFVGEYRGEERADVLRIVCPPVDDERRWSDFDLERVKAT